MGGATDGYPAAEHFAQKPFQELESSDIQELLSAEASYLRKVYSCAEQAGNERLLGAVAAIASMKVGREDPSIYALLNEAFPNQVWQVW